MTNNDPKPTGKLVARDLPKRNIRRRPVQDNTPDTETTGDNGAHKDTD